MRMMRALRRGPWPLAIVGALFAVLPTAVSAQTIGCGRAADTAIAGTANQEAHLLALVNNSRSQQGLAPLTEHPDLAARARAWSEHMAREGAISHSDLSTGLPADARSGAENVGCDHSVDEQHQAFLASPGHRQNIMTPEFTHLGVGFAYDPDGTLYTTEVFMASAAPAVSPESPPAVVAPTPPAPAPAPAPPPPPAPPLPPADQLAPAVAPPPVPPPAVVPVQPVVPPAPPLVDWNQRVNALVARLKTLAAPEVVDLVRRLAATVEGSLSPFGSRPRTEPPQG